MKNGKNILLGIVITIAILLITMTFPIIKLREVNDYYNSKISISNKNIWNSSMQNILSSNVSQEIKDNATDIITDNRNTLDNIMNNYYKLHIYLITMMSAISIILGIIIFKKSDSHKYVGISFIIAGLIISILLAYIIITTYF